MAKKFSVEEIDKAIESKFNVLFYDLKEDTALCNQILDLQRMKRNLLNSEK